MTESNPSEISPAGRFRIEQVPGLDLADALERVMGNRVLYESLLRLFRDQYRLAPERIEAGMNRGAWRDVEELIHSIKGTSGMLGAMAVHCAAQCLDQSLKEAIRTGVAPPETYPAIDRFLSELKAFLLNLERAEETNSGSSLP